ncbi:C3a anaphylatoxin chemotactic receptor-like isoform 1-T2 [Anomaloglossus baeobatrachus]|uniref:C3a anaphylatoxin chemotactic receptor-like n=1 Tax=Anomaloglossus baeobatrachus TaxID=238106 RepID=UPI003F5016DF
MKQELHKNRELQKKVCELYWDIYNDPELGDLSPSMSHPTAIQYSSFVLSIITCIIGFTGNLLVIFVIGFLMKKTKSQIWFLNLAVADFSFLLFLPLQAVSVLSARWPYGPSMCKFYNFITFVNMYASIYILTALNIDRTLSVAKPIWHQRFLSRKFGYSICLLIWVLSAVCSIPAVVYSDQVLTSEKPQCILFSNEITSLVYSNIKPNSNLSQTWRGLYRKSCDMTFPNESIFKLWVEMQSSMMSLLVPLAVIGCIIPLCVILSSNIIIIHHVKKSQVPSSSRLYRVVIAAILVFFCTRTPLVLAQIIFLVSAHTMEFTLMYKVIAFFPLLSSIAATNTFLNPVVYVLVGKKFREEISQFSWKNREDAIYQMCGYMRNIFPSR